MEREELQKAVDRAASLIFAVGKIAEEIVGSGRNEDAFWELYWMATEEIEKIRKIAY